MASCGRDVVWHLRTSRRTHVWHKTQSKQVINQMQVCYTYSAMSFSSL